MEDIPRSSGNTFIIYSNSLKEPKFAQAPSLSAVTGIDSVSGSLNNEDLTIKWKDGNWQATCAKISTFGNYSFSVSVKSKGSDSRKSATSNFTFDVILLYMDDTYDLIYKQYQVGDKVNETLEEKTANAVLSYGVWGQLYSPDEERYGSGLYLSLIDEKGDGFEVPKLTGTAARPGIYVAAIHCATDDGENDFSGGTDMPTPIIISIRDKDYEENQAMVVTNTPAQHNENILRLIYCQEHPFTEKGGNFSLSLSGNADSGVWIGKYEEQAQTTIIVTEYQIVLSGSRWELKRREYTQGDEKLPDFEKISSAAQISGSKFPPSAAWSNDVVICGDAQYYVPGYGFFDYKGIVNNNPIYQQQTLHTRQYDGWKNRGTEFKYNDGLILQQKEINGKLEWVLPSIDSQTGISSDKIVTPQEFAGVVVPYAPPTTEKYGSKPVRDLSFDGVNIHTPPGNVAILNGNIAGGFWRWPDERRELVPYNGTSGDEDCYMSEISVMLEKYSLYQAHEKYENTYMEGMGEYNKGESDTTRKQGVKLDLTIPRQKLKYSRRDGDAFAWLMTLDTPEKDWEHTWEGEYQATGLIGIYPDGIENDYKKFTNWESEGIYTKSDDKPTQSDTPTKVMFYIAGGADYTTGKWHNLWCLPRWQGGTVMLNAKDKEVIATTQFYEGSSEPEKMEIEYQYSNSISFTPNFLLRVPKLIEAGDDFSVDTQTVIKESSTFVAKIRQYQSFLDYDENGGDYWLSSVDIRLYYDLKITQVKTYTEINGEEIIDNLTVTMTKEIKNAGTYPDNFPPTETVKVEYKAIDGKGTITTTSNNVTDTQELDFAQVIEQAKQETSAAINQAKEDVSSCELEKTNTYEDYAHGEWSFTSEEEKMEITT
jgi:hypothetical protein